MSVERGGREGLYDWCGCLMCDVWVVWCSGGGMFYDFVYRQRKVWSGLWDVR